MTLKELLTGNYSEQNLLPNELQVCRFVKEWSAGSDQFKISTSGSTGKPKEIHLSRKALTISALTTIKYFQLSDADTALICIDVRHVGGLMMLVRSLIAEMNVIIQEPNSDPLSLLEVDDKPTFMPLVPLQLEKVLQAKEVDINRLNQLKAIIVGGAPVSQQLFKRIEATDIPIYQTFGMTETISHVALRRLNGSGKSKFYQLLPGWLMTTDKDNKLSLHNEGITNGWLQTNDVVEIIDDSLFHWLGRYDNVVNSGGIKIVPEIVENQIRSILEDIEINFILGGIEDPLLGQRLILVIEGQKDGEVESKLIAQLSGNLEKYHIPKEIFYVQKFARTKNGKIKRSEILKSLQRRR